jgi:hypothetical protein
MATAGSAGTPSVEVSATLITPKEELVSHLFIPQMLATQDVFFDRKMSPWIGILTLLSSQLIG